MASSINSDQANMKRNVGQLLADVLKILSKSTESVELFTTQNKNDKHINDMLALDVTTNHNNATAEKTGQSPRQSAVTEKCSEDLGRAQEGFFSACTSTEFGIGDTSCGSDTHLSSQFSSTTDEQHGKIDNQETQAANERHIMISYHRQSSFDVCRKICNKLRKCGYKVWMDQDNLHRSLSDGMAEGVENSYIVLICYNSDYSKSEYCKREFTYTVRKGIDFIPCRLQKPYKPCGWLGFDLSDFLYFDFSDPNNFDQPFKELIAEIKHTVSRVSRHPNLTEYLRSNNNTMNNQIMRARFNATIQEYKESINKSGHDLSLLTKEELRELIIRLQERLFNDTLSTSNSDDEHSKHQIQNNDKLLRAIFEQTNNLRELLTKITDILSELTDFKTIIKFSLAYLFVWTVKTHIIDAYFKYD